MGTEASTVLDPLWQGLPETARKQVLPPIDPGAVAGAASCALPAAYEAVSGARRFTVATLQTWELEGLCDDVALVVSELVTNALRHALPSRNGSAVAAEGAEAGEADPPVRLHLMRWASRLVCAVRDPSGDSPVAGDAPDCEADFAAESGRGLWLVSSFSDSWGWHPLAGALRGKVVWALFRLPGDQDPAPV